jgi:glyoxylase-like metal-dependent hydrolase (beta-lactamase superfamily II)
MRAVSLHHDVVLVTSALLQANCTIVRGAGGEGPEAGRREPLAGAGIDGAERLPAETFVIDSPVLPDELELLPQLLEQSRFEQPSGLLATHADWDHLLGRLAFAEVALGCAESSAARLAAEPGAAQRELRSFDEELYLRRGRPLALGSVQALPVPGRCGIGEAELELHAAEGHTADGMAVWIPWARVLVAGDYISTVEIPTFGEGGDLDAYLATLERLRPLATAAERVVPGHGPAIDAARAAGVIDEDVAYLQGLRERGADAELPAGRRSREQRRLHAANVARLERQR